MLLALALLAAPIQQDGPLAPALVPWPAEVTWAEEAMLLRPLRIVLRDRGRGLESLAEALEEDLPRFVPGLRWATLYDRDLPLVLDVDPELPDDWEYELTIGEREIRVRGRDSRAVVHGTVTLQQAFTRWDDGTLALPRGRIRDRADAPFRGLMVDVARQRNTIPDLTRIVDLCRLYKIDVLQLHLSDDQGWTFPSERFPQLGTENWNDVPRYRPSRLRALVRYADARGVTIVPEIDLPGHSAAMRRALPEVFDPAGLGNVNVATEPVWTALEELLDEVCDVFASSPYVHVGGDEVSGFERVFELYRDDPWVRERGIESAHELFGAFLVHAAELVEARGKRLMAWEGHREASPALARILWVAWENAYFPLPDMLVAGYEVVNATWCPLYLLEGQTDVTPEFLYENWGRTVYGRYRGLPRSIERCDLFEVAPTDALVGGLFCSWENAGGFQLEGLRPLLPAFAERLWNPAARARGFDDFESRAARVDAAFARAASLDERPPAAAPRGTATRSHLTESFAESLGDRWKRRSENGACAVVDPGLAYPGLAATGGALRFQLESDTPNLTLARPLEGGPLAPGDEVWLSYLLRVEGPINPGHLYVRLGGQPLAVGKRWGATFAIDNTGATTPVEAGHTHLLVARYVLAADADGGARVDLWVDPPLGAEPQDDVRHDTKTADLAPTGELVLDVQGHSAPRGTWTIDELRVGGTWSDVLPDDPADSRRVPAPVGELAGDGAGGRALVLWARAAGAQGYRVFRAPYETAAPPPRANGRLVGAVEEPEFVDVRAIPGLRYRYWVVPRNEHGAGPARSCDLRIEARTSRARATGDDGIERLAGPESPLRRRMRLAFYGDSITDNSDYARALREAVASSEHTGDLGVVFLNRGINGGKAEDLLLGIRRWGAGGGLADPLPFFEQLAADDPDVAVIYVGVNEPNDLPARDYPAGTVEHDSPPTSDADYRAHLTALVRAAQGAGARVVLATPSVNGELPRGENPLDGRLDALAQVAREVATEERAELVDLRAAFQAWLDEHVEERARAGSLTADGVHPNERGTRLTAELVAAGITRVLAN